MPRATVFKVLLVCIVLASAGALSASAGASPHQEDAAVPIVQISEFAHGYLHGYEAGYHAGDEDFQIGHVRESRNLREIKETFAKDSRPLFRQGYQQGFAAGYEDSVSGRDFRVVNALREIARGQEQSEPASFDLGLANGYAAGRTRGMEDQSADTDFDTASGPCPVTATTEGTRTYCEGYARAYSLGYRDGYLAQPQPSATQVASSK